MKDILDLISQMELKGKLIHFDAATLSCLPMPVMKKLRENRLRRNSRGPESERRWAQAERARDLCGKRINADSTEIFFVQDVAMGMNFVANAIGLQPGDNVILTNMDFSANVYPWLNLQSVGVEVRFVQSKDGLFTPEQFEALIDERTRVISVSWVIPENGTVLDICRLGEICRMHHIYFAVSATHGFGLQPVDVKRVQCDFFAADFFRWPMGPDGVAFVYVNRAILERLRYPWMGWAGMKDRLTRVDYLIDPAVGASRFETGSLNFSGLSGVAACMEFTDGCEQEIYERVCRLVGYLRAALSQIPGVRLLSRCETLSGITQFAVERQAELAAALQADGFQFSQWNGIRISLHFYNTKEEIDQMIQHVYDVTLL